MNFELFVCKNTRSHRYLPKSYCSFESYYKREFGCLEIAVKCVDSFHDAIEHIREHSSSHTDCIVTEEFGDAEVFMDWVDSAGVYHNASTRFADSLVAVLELRLV